MKKFLPAICMAICLQYACNKNDLYTQKVIDAADASDARDLSPMRQPMSDDFASIPQDPQNPLNSSKVELGKLLFHESRLGLNPTQPEGLHTYSCASCHHAEAGFQAGLSQGLSEGGSGFGTKGEGRITSVSYTIGNIDLQPIRTPSVLHTAYQEVMLWNGELGGVGINIGTEAKWTNSGNENNFTGLHGLEILGLASRAKHRLNPDTTWLASNGTYKNLFDLAFPEIPEAGRINSRTVSLALGAYQRILLANQSPFQRFLRGETKAMTRDQKDGKNLFFGKAKCSNCHTGPGLSSMQFAAIGMNDMQEGVNGVIHVTENNRESKGRGGFTDNDNDLYKFKIPQLYNLRDVSALGHGGNFTSIEEVIRYKNAGIPQNSKVPTARISKQFKPLFLTEPEIDRLVKFVRDALYDPNLSRYVPATVPSGNCIPNNDAQSRIDRGCQ